MQSQRRSRPLRERLLSRAIIDWDTGCWNWAGAKSGGYGRIGLGAKSRAVDLTHRVAWRLWYGPIPPELTIDHLCRNRLCCNPAHLDVVTQKVNVLRSENAAAVNSRKTHCKRGHEFDLLNTAFNASGRRACRACRSLYRSSAQVADPSTTQHRVTHCLHGHEYTPENSYINSKGWRECRTCRKAQASGWRERQEATR